MTFLATQPVEERQQRQTLAQTPGDPDAFKPGFLAGSGEAAAVGLGRVVGVANQLAGEAEYQVGALFTRPLDAIFDTRLTGFLDEKLRRGPAELTASMTPDPVTTGTLGQILYSLVGIGVPAAAGTYFGGPVGGAALAGTFQTAGTFTDLTQQNVDPNTAAGAAVFEGALTAAGVGLPMAIGGKVALNSLVYGPGINVAQDLIAGQGTAAWLEARGYDQLADRYATLDAELLAADVILGAAFGYYGARAARRPVTAAGIDAAHAALDQRHIELDTAPGIPADMAAMQAHVRALQSATEALLDGRQVTADVGGNFAPRPRAPNRSDSVLAQAFRDSGLPELIDEVGALEAELAKRGRPLLADEDPLPDLGAALDRLEQGGASLGRTTDVKIGNEYAAARWAVMEADQVAPTLTIADNQLRDRTRLAAELQVVEIANNLDPRLLLVDAPMMDVGAPTLTADGKVVAGNGRAMALRRAYSGERGQAYRAALVEAAPRFGVDPGAIASMQAPVLVRVLQQAVDVERAAILSNEGGAMRMSGLEQARVDAGRLPGLADVDIPESGDFTAANLREWVRGWIGQFPAGQRAGLVDADGALSQEGLTRLRNAVLFRAYGDSPVLQRLVESADPGARNVANALVRVAPRVADVKDAIARGELHPLDISDDLVRSADLVERIRDQGLTVKQWIDQLDLFNPGESPTTLALLRFIDANKRSGKAIADLLTGYYESVVKAGNPGQGDMLGAGAPDRHLLLARAIAEAAPDKADAIVQSSLFRPTRAEPDDRDIVNPIDPLASPDEKLAQIAKLTAENKPVVDAFLQKLDAALDAADPGAPKHHSKSNIKADAMILAKASRPSILAKKPWYGVEHLRDTFRFKTVINSINDLPLIARHAAEQGWEVVKVDTDKLLQPKEWGWRFVALDMRMPNGQLVEWYMPFAELEAAKKAGGHQLFEKWRNRDIAELTPAERVEMNADLNAARQLYQRAFDAAIKGQEESAVRAALASFKASALSVTVSKLARSPPVNRKGGLDSQAPSTRTAMNPSEPLTNTKPSGERDTRSAVRRDIGTSGEENVARQAAIAQGATVAAEKPHLPVALEDGTRSAAEALQRAEVAEARAQTDAAGFEAAVNCFLRSGT